MAAQTGPVTIVGAGPSGLATAAYLRHLSIPYTILEREDCFAPIWQKYSYDRVHLHLVKQACELPLMPMPKNYPSYPSKSEFIHYLNDYVAHFEISPKYGRFVETASYDETAGKWKIAARNLGSDVVEDYWSRFLVVASGETCDPSCPKIEGLETFWGEVMHSTRYKNGKKFVGKNVLVVGSGNSGMEIALDLAECGAKTSIVVRSPIHILSRQMMYAGVVLFQYLPFNWVEYLVTMMSKVVYGDLTKYGIQRPREGPFVCKAKYNKYPVLDVGTFDKIKSGEIQVLPGIRSIKGNNVLFENGKENPFDAIIFATGFKRCTQQWLKEDDNLLSDEGIPKPSFPHSWKGNNGLYCAGLAGRGLYGSKMDAQNIAQDIKAQL
ncbi:Flavin-containing monooxygenase [Handroanthus impetiginosus]|uniref:Flavin-containing monooxygenase n=1 Tax=Handroanthus impetiginosus TaxID=429701 RepID=A0A2G9GNH8_9LAMI|nr:Flavin-containing monooxygenase [Handroanthus impetiginosus]